MCYVYTFVSCNVCVVYIHLCHYMSQYVICNVCLTDKGWRRTIEFVIIIQVIFRQFDQQLMAHLGNNDLNYNELYGPSPPLTYITYIDFHTVILYVTHTLHITYHMRFTIHFISHITYIYISYYILPTHFSIHFMLHT